ncbi:acyltransferase family protein [Nitrospira sp. Nam80]
MSSVQIFLEQDKSFSKAPGVSAQSDRLALSEILSRNRLPALDGLRAIAVFIVIVYHFGFTSVPGDLGVTAFFVLSGFLITWLLLQEYSQTGSISLGQFYIRRTFRIAPAYYGFLFLIYIEEQLRGYHWDVLLTLSGFFYFVNYYNAFNGHPDTAIAHAWSLGVEQQFYLLWPLLLGAIIHRGSRSAALIIASTVCLIAGWRSVAYLYFGASPSYVYNAFETRFDSLAIGCLLAVCCRLGWFEMAAMTLSRNILFPFAILALLLYSRIGGSDSYHYSLGFTVDSLLIAIFMTQLLSLSNRTLWSWIDHPTMVYLGRISYSLYLYHLLALGIGHRLVSDSLVIEFTISVFLCVVIASASYWLIERPFLRLRNQFAQVGAVS